MKKLLLIEEETCSRNLFAACLEAEGYEIDVAKDDSIGIQVAQNQSPDLVICSLTISSFKETLSGFRQDALMIDVPFILLSATLTQAEIPQYRGKTQDSYLAKPTTVDELLDAIAIQLERQVENHSLSQNYSGFSSDGSDDLICSESIFPAIEQLSEVFEFIELNYYHPITLNHVAQAAGYSPAYLTNLVGSRSGLTVSRWITEGRMVEVRSLLQYSDFSIEQIASKVGYANVRHLFRQFRQYHNMTPQIWRQKHRS